ncbi:MAG: hypothetical protein WBP46_07030 [Thiolinea sp.]
MLAKPQKTCILILGMHRSGTSCLAGSLQQQGVYLGDVHEWNPHNLKGNRENPKIMELNESLFASNHATWDRPSDQAVSWSTSQAQQRDQLIEALSLEAQQAWGFKDPRTLINLDFWQDGLRDQYPTKFIGTFRHPLAVAQSLHKRNGTPLEEGLALWYAYNKRLVASWERQPFPILSFDVASDLYSKDFKQACGDLGLKFSSVEQPFLENQLRSTESKTSHHDYQIKDSRYLDCYARLQTIYLDWAA